jgi:hypothetical protein
MWHAIWRNMRIKLWPKNWREEINGKTVACGFFLWCISPRCQCVSSVKWYKIDEWWIWNDLEASGHVLMRIIYREFAWKNWGKPMVTNQVRRCHFRSLIRPPPVVGIATRYGLDGPGIESQWGRDFPQPSRPVLGPTQPPIQWVPGHSRGWSGRGVEFTTHPHLVPGLKKE